MMIRRVALLTAQGLIFLCLIGICISAATIGVMAGDIGTTVMSALLGLGAALIFMADAIDEPGGNVQGKAKFWREITFTRNLTVTDEAMEQIYDIARNNEAGTRT